MGNRTSWVLGGVAVWLACGPPASLPADLLGVWQHPDPAYADRTLEIQADSIAFGTGDGGRDVFPISSVETEVDGATTLVKIGYRQEDGVLMPLRLSFTAGPTPALRLGRREGIWRPASATATRSSLEEAP